MHILLNGQTEDIPDTLTAQELIQRLDLGARRFAVEINRTVVPRSRLGETRLNDGDRVEIVQAIGGG